MASLNLNVLFNELSMVNKCNDRNPYPANHKPSAIDTLSCSSAGKV
jgi:hypothetical protein